jgi:hypothetical protein
MMLLLLLLHDLELYVRLRHRWCGQDHCQPQTQRWAGAASTAGPVALLLYGDLC